MSSSSKVFWSQADALEHMFSHLNRSEAEAAREINCVCKEFGAKAGWRSVDLRELIPKVPAIAFQGNRDPSGTMFVTTGASIRLDNLARTRPYVEDDWSHLYSITNKIHVLMVREDLQHAVSDLATSTAFFAELIADSPYPSLFPNLTTFQLTLSPSTPQTYPLASHIVKTSPLRCLHLRVAVSPESPGWSIAVYNMAETIILDAARHCHDLETLQLDLVTSPGEHQAAASMIRAPVSAVGQLPLLRNVTLSHLDLATIPSPQTMESWSQLEELHLNYCQTLAVSQCLDRAAGCRLNVKRLFIRGISHSLTLDRQESWSHFSALFLVINRVLSKIESIDLEDLEDYHPCRVNGIDTLRVLKNFTKLKRFATEQNHFALNLQALSLLRHDMPNVEFIIPWLEYEGWGNDLEITEQPPGRGI